MPPEKFSILTCYRTSENALCVVGKGLLSLICSRWKGTKSCGQMIGQSRFSYQSQRKVTLSNAVNRTIAPFSHCSKIALKNSWPNEKSS